MDIMDIMEIVEGCKYLLPVDIPVTAVKPTAVMVADGLLWLLLGPGGWGYWGVAADGAIAAIRNGKGRKPDVSPTGWSVQQLRAWPAGVEGKTLDAVPANIDTWQDNHGVKHL